MNFFLTLSIPFTLLCFKTNAQPTKPILKFKNSILYQNDEKIFSYKPNGEILIFDYLDGSISLKLTVSAPNGSKLNIDTLNLDTLTNKIMQIQQGIGQYDSWIFNKAIRYQKGKIKSNTLFSNGGRTALFSSFDKDGRPIEKGNYIDNKKDGEWFKYDENGKIARKKIYNNGVEQAEEIYYPPH